MPNGQGGDGIYTCEHCGGRLKGGGQGSGDICYTSNCPGNWYGGKDDQHKATAKKQVKSKPLNESYNLNTKKELAAAKAENAQLRVALERIAGDGEGAVEAYHRRRTVPDDGMSGIAGGLISAKRIAKQALQKDEEE